MSPAKSAVCGISVLLLAWADGAGGESRVAPTLAPAVQAVAEAVVTIRTAARPRVIDAPEDDTTEVEVGLPDPASNDPAGAWPPSHLTLGTAVIIDPAGIAVTHAEVLRRSPDLEAVTADGRVHKVAVVATDQKSGVGVFRIQGLRPGVRVARFGDSDRVRVGDWVVAIGTPFGLRASVTAGIVSAREGQPGRALFGDFLQTDALMGRGTIGGPLLNLEGEVIGLSAGGYADVAGIGFALPSNLVANVSRQLLEHGVVSRGWLGVSSQPLTPALARVFQLPDTPALLVADVVGDGPAARSGLRRGDVIGSYDERPLREPADLVRAVEQSLPGHVALLLVRRGARQLSLSVTLGDDRDLATESLMLRRATRPLGFDVRAIGPDMGVVVGHVDPWTAAHDAGVRRGDVIREIAHQPVRTTRDVVRLAEQVSRGAPMLLQRGETALYVALPAPAE
jgi:serine protease Do